MNLLAEKAFLLLDEPADFDRAAYAYTFGPYLWTYAAGYKELVHLFHLAHGKPFNRASMLAVIAGWHMAAIQDIPENWKQEFEKDAQWSTINPDQIVKASKGELMRFDRGCQAIRALDLAFRFSAIDALRTLDVCSVVQLRPAIYKLDDKKALAWLEHGKDAEHEALVKELSTGRKESSARKAALLLSEVAQGRTVTHVNAMRIQEHVRRAGFKTAAFNAIRSRPRQRPCEHEACFVTLTPAAAELISAKHATAKVTA